MSYVSVLYLFICLPALLLLWTPVPQRHRWKLLLAANCIFYLSVSGKLILYLFLSAACVHHLGLWMDRCDTDLRDSAGSAELPALRAACTKKKRTILRAGILLLIGALFVLKYLNFISGNLNQLLACFSRPAVFPQFSMTFPLGVSFFTLQAVSYLVDVYYGKMRADDDFCRILLWMSFFPTVEEGPICRYSDTAKQLTEGAGLRYENVAFGVQLMIWGLFKKVVVADRLAPLVKQVFSHWQNYSGLAVLFAAVCYTLQLYADFSGCIDLSIGTAEMFGIRLPQNFRQPFFSRSASEFWRRWHITLGAWFRDYVFYPVSLSRAAKSFGKRVRRRFGRYPGQVAQTVLPLLTVWLCNGLWHGTGWNYIFFGLYYFAVILLENILQPLTKRADRLSGVRGACIGVLRGIKMAVIIVTGELFFRANGFQAGFSMFRSIFTGFSITAFTDGTLLKLNLSAAELVCAAAGIGVMLAVDLLHEKRISIRASVASRRLGVRWAFWIAAVLVVLIFGAFGNGYTAVDPMYASF